MTLDTLLIDGRDLDRNLAATLLAPYLRIDRETAAIVPLMPWTRLPVEARILLYLVARRAMAALDLVPVALATPKEIEQATGIRGGSVRPALQKLHRRRLVARTAIGTWQYAVPNTALAEVAAFVGQYWTVEVGR